MWYIFMLDVLGLFLLSGAYLLKLCFNTEIRAQLRLLCQLSSLSCKYKCMMESQHPQLWRGFCQ